ncbi:MAG: hypothetical protein GXO78_11695 [Calditrichaeota bacterium]|nr:hypothetical protein [Calditrichota bacterium]
MFGKHKKLQLIARRLSTHELTRLRESDISLEPQQLLAESPDERSTPYFLGFYSPSGIRLALEKYGVFKALKKKGFDGFEMVIDTRDPYRHRFALYFDHTVDEHTLLAEVVLKRRFITFCPPFPSPVHGRSYEFLQVEWLVLQNPRKSFSPERPRLPGQKYPGLGMGEMVLEILLIMCWRLGLAGLLNVPEYYHNAQMYAQEFCFIDPYLEGKLRALERDLYASHGLAKSSWAIELGCVEENGKPYEWQSGEMIIPLNRDLKAFFKHASYQQYVAKIKEQYQYRLNERCWEERKQKLPDGVLL